MGRRIEIREHGARERAGERLRRMPRQRLARGFHERRVEGAAPRARAGRVTCRASARSRTFSIASVRPGDDRLARAVVRLTIRTSVRSPISSATTSGPVSRAAIASGPIAGRVAQEPAAALGEPGQARGCPGRPRRGAQRARHSCARRSCPAPRPGSASSRSRPTLAAPMAGWATSVARKASACRRRVVVVEGGRREDPRPDRLAASRRDRRVEFLEGAADFVEVDRQVAQHPHGLRALPREEERDLLIRERGSLREVDAAGIRQLRSSAANRVPGEVQLGDQVVVRGRRRSPGSGPSAAFRAGPPGRVREVATAEAVRPRPAAPPGDPGRGARPRDRRPTTRSSSAGQSRVARHRASLPGRARRPRAPRGSSCRRIRTR